MAVKNKADTFSNIAALRVTETAANTMTSAKFSFPFSIMDKMALVIQRMEYLIEGLSSFDGTGDNVTVALACASAVTDLTNQADPLIIDSIRYARLDIGAAASGLILQFPWTKDFTTLEGKGILVAPNPLYAIIKGVNASAAMSCWVKLFYTYMELGTDEYWQLVESRRIISS